MSGLTIKEKLAASKREMGLDEDSNINVSSKKTSNEGQQNPGIITPKKTSESVEPLLFVNGKLNKAEHEYINKNFFVHKGLYNDITLYCRGMDTAIFNYLLHLGLEALKLDNNHKNVDISEIEATYQ